MSLKVGGRGRATLMMILTVIVLPSADFHAAEVNGAERLIDQQPFDQLTLKEEGKVFQLLPLEMVKREPLRDQERGEWLVVRLLERPDQRYQVRWRDIARLQLFEELVLEEAARLEDAGDFDQAHESYNFLQRRAAEFPGLTAARHRCLWREAEYWLGQARYHRALALLNELYRQDARYPGLKEISGRVVDRLVQEYFAAGDHAAARALLEGLSAKFVGHEVVAARHGQLTQLASQWYDKAHAAADQERWREAHNMVRTALTIWPDLPSARQLEVELNEKYPVVRIGVREGWSQQLPTVPTAWSARRCELLVDRFLCEPVSFGEDGGDYVSAVSSYQTQERRTLLQLESRVTWPHNGRPLSSMDVARQLLALGRTPDSPVAQQLNLAVESICVSEANSLEIIWRRNIPCWPALLHIPIAPWDSAGGVLEESPRLGPYRPADVGKDLQVFALQDGYYEVGEHQPREVVETTCPDAVSALRALRERRIDAFDRVAPWEMSLVESQTDLQLVKYAAPTVHLLLSNPNSPWMASGLVRRAVVKALDRELILREILRCRETDGGRLLTGPFPSGYACNKSAGVQTRDPRLAAVLLNSWVDMAKEEMKGRPITLIHPSTDIARRAAHAMQAQLQLDGLGVNVVLEESSVVDLCQGPGRPWDLWYVEWYAMEPWTDAEKLLGPGSVLAPVEPQLAESLFQLSRCATRAEAITALQEIDRRTAETATVIPLWQIDEYAVVHRSLQGIPARPVSLYQNIQQWQVTLEP